MQPSEAKAPRQDRFAIINNAFLALLEKTIDLPKCRNIANGINSNVNYMKVIVSEELPAKNCSSTKEDGYDNFIEGTEARRLQSAFIQVFVALLFMMQELEEIMP